MNILFIISGTQRNTGSTKSAINLLRELSKHHNILAVIPDAGPIKELLEELGIKVYVTRYYFNVEQNKATIKEKILYIPRLMRMLYCNYVSSRKLVKVASDFKTDLIHCNNCVINVGLHAGRKLHLPHLTHIREYVNQSADQYWVYNLKSQFRGDGKYTVCITKGLAEVNGLSGLKSNEVVYNPIVSIKDFLELRPKKRQILYVGRVEAGKGITDMIDAYAAYCNESDNPAPLKIAGSCDTYSSRYQKSICNAKISKYGIDDKVEWLGDVENIMDLMAESKLVAIPSLHEGFGRVFSEALAAGSLVIARDCTGLHEQFENGLEMNGAEIGLRFNDIEILAQGLKRGIDMKEEEYKGFVNRGRKTVKELYTIENSAARMLKLYEKIANDFHLSH